MNYFLVSQVCEFYSKTAGLRHIREWPRSGGPSPRLNQEELAGVVQKIALF